MSSIVKVNLVYYQCAGYSIWYYESAYTSFLINLYNVNRIKRNNDNSLKDTNALVYFIDSDKGCYFNETLDEFNYFYIIN